MNLMLKLNAKPEPIAIDLAHAAVLVVDMQNAFATKGGMLDLAGIDISGSSRVAESIRKILDSARRAGVLIVYLQMGYNPDLSNAGSIHSPNYHKELAMHLMKSRPELKGKLLTEGTWDFAIVEELQPKAGDFVVLKTRYSGFAGTTLDSQLRSHAIRYLFFLGIATNVCVESTLRDAYFLDYWPILIADAALPAGSLALHEATLYNVENFFGWTLNSNQFLDALHSTGS
jgi:ureidoacrylate peracid hydrolase